MQAKQDLIKTALQDPQKHDNWCSPKLTESKRNISKIRKQKKLTSVKNIETPRRGGKTNRPTNKNTPLQPDT